MTHRPQQESTDTAETMSEDATVTQQPAQVVSDEKNEKENSQDAQIAELTDLLQRTQANFENYRKQNLKQMEEYQQFACKDMIMQLLPLLDNFELALKVSASSVEDLKKGIELIYAQLFQILENIGVTPLITANATFDPHLHEPLMKVESEQPAGTILEEFQKGFMLHGRVIRHAKVKISAGKSPTGDAKDAKGEQDGH